MITTSAIVPQPSAFMNNQNGGAINNALKPNGGAVGAFELPTTPTKSWAIPFEGVISPGLGYGTNETQYILGEGATGATGSGLQVAGNLNGQPAWYFQRNAGGASPGSNWWNAISLNTLNGGSTANSGSGYLGGYYSFTATNSTCAREPTAIWTVGGGVDVVDPGFLCGASPTFTSIIPGDGAQQATGAGSVTTTCVSNSPVSGEMTVTAHVAVAHGVLPSQTYALQGFTPTGYNAIYTALQGTTGTTLVGETTTGGGTCPAAVSGEGTALSGTGASFTLNLTPTSIGAFGITTKTGQHFCGVIGEYGDNSPFPGAQFASFVDDNGNALPGAPALVPWLNQGVATGIVGFVVAATQPALTVTAMTPTTITAASYSAGQVTFTTSTSTGLIKGSEFTVSGMMPSGYNQTYVAVAGTSGATIVGNPLSGPVGVPQALSNPGSFVSGGQLVSVIMPGMQIPGLSLGNVVLPFGQGGGTGAGGIGTYTLSANQTTSTLTARIDNGTIGNAGNTLTVSAVAGGSQSLVIGSTITVPGGTNVTITAFLTGAGGAGSYTVNGTAQNIASESMTNQGTIGSSGSPVTMFAAPAFYQTVNAVGTVTARSQTTVSDFITVLGSNNANLVANNVGWSGAMANVGMLWGVFPQTTGGAPSTTALASLCKKQTTIQSFAAANSLTVHSLYELNDLGIFGDSGLADMSGSIAGTALTITSSPLPSTLPPNTIISGVV